VHWREYRIIRRDSMRFGSGMRIYLKLRQDSTDMSSSK
jgi:hypothetical protein